MRFKELINNKEIHNLRIFLLLCLVGLFVSCSTTKHLPEGEVLYIGQKKTQITNPTPTPVGEIAISEIEGAINKKPNNSLLGSVTHRFPLPIGLWFYSGFQKYNKGFGKWILNTFGTTPIYLSTVNPEIRTKIASNLLSDYGYFNGKVNYEIIPHSKDSLKAKVFYSIDMGTPTFIDTVYYENFQPHTLSILERARRGSIIKKGQQFNVVDLDDERNRVSGLLRNVGYYYFRPSYLTYHADSTQVKDSVSLKLLPVKGVPKEAQRRYYNGKTAFILFGKNGEAPNKEMEYEDLTILYYNKLNLRPKMLHRWINSTQFSSLRRRKGGERPNYYSQYRQRRIQEKLNELGIFRYVELNYFPRDTIHKSDTLDLNIQASFDKMINAELELNLAMKSNDQAGPGAAFSLSRNNVFKGGETWEIKLRGSYEWQTGKKTDKNSLMNSYELGVSSSLIIPRLLFPTLRKNEYEFPTTTTFKLYIDQLNRAKFYKILSFGGTVSYDWKPKRTSRHQFTPLNLNFNLLQHTTARFDAIINENKMLAISMQNQFIPKMEYTYTYDNAPMKGRIRKNQIWWQTTVSSSGNITSLAYRAFGQDFSKKNKEFLNAPFAQFLKINTELRYTWNFSPKQSIVARFIGGVISSYGNSQVAPYTEQFYIGGANSIRAYTVRSIGPGSYYPGERGRYTFIDQTGDIRLEANIEYRFPIVGDLRGALFLDAGNVWLLRNDEDRPGAKFNLKKFPEQVALGTGFGVRYDLDFLVFRLDCGVALHNPYKTSRSGYYNIERFKDGLGIHFAIGYPF